MEAQYVDVVFLFRPTYLYRIDNVTSHRGSWCLSHAAGLDRSHVGGV